MSISTQANEIIKIGTVALEDKKAEDIKCIDISEISIVADAIVITSGNNKNQIQAMCDELQERLGKDGVHPLCVEGYESANWVLLDYNDVIFHIFDKESRNFYDLERLYRDGKLI